MRPSARLFIRCRRGSFIPPPHRLSSMLYSPMYPQRPMPEIPEGKYKESTEDDDFLSRHGGKVALVGFSFAMALVYRWFKGGSNKNELEAAIKGSFLVNPVEFSELRHNNSIGIDLYRAIIDDAHTFFPDHYASYADFIAFVQSKLEVAEVPPLAHAHILDRMILPSIEAGNAQATSHGIENDTTNADGKQWRVQMSADGRLPLHFLLVCFNAAVREKGEIRISSLFRIAETISMGEIGEFSSELAQRGGGKCTEAQLKELIQSLQASYQIPAEKQVAETGVSLPVNTFRRKTSEELVTDAITLYESTEIDGGKPVLNRRSIDEDTFLRIMEGNAVCVWGQCYYAKN